MLFISRLAAALVVLTIGPAVARGASSQDYGPPRGTLVVVGGGNLEGTGILERFIERTRLQVSAPHRNRPARERTKPVG
jgi:hypothetical protein